VTISSWRCRRKSIPFHHRLGAPFSFFGSESRSRIVCSTWRSDSFFWISSWSCCSSRSIWAIAARCAALDKDGDGGMLGISVVVVVVVAKDCGSVFVATVGQAVGDGRVTTDGVAAMYVDRLCGVMIRATATATVTARTSSSRNEHNFARNEVKPNSHSI